jgi:hypothetical protein
MPSKNKLLDRSIEDNPRVRSPRGLRSLALGLVAMWGVLGLPQAVLAVAEVEPNNPCTSAQDLTTDVTAFPYTQDGNLDSSVNPDVDFFKFSGTPGAMLKVDLAAILGKEGKESIPSSGFLIQVVI